METSHRPVRSGALTLLFTVVLLCLAVLAVLSLATARADEALAKKSLDRLAQEAAAEQAGQEWLAALDAAGRHRLHRGRRGAGRADAGKRRHPAPGRRAGGGGLADHPLAADRPLGTGHLAGCVDRTVTPPPRGRKRGMLYGDP